MAVTRRPARGVALLPVALAAALLAAPTGAAHAQRRVSSSLDVGLSSVRYADTVNASSAALSSGLRVETARAAGAAQGTFARTGAGAWVLQGGMDGSLYTPAAGWLVGELAASVGGSAHQDHTRTGQTIATARAHLMHGSRGAWLGAGGGRAWDGAAWHGVALGEAGAWWAGAHGASLVATATPTAVDVGGTMVRYADAALAARWANARAELTGSLGARIGGDTIARLGGSASWGSVAGALWIAGPLALVASGGSYPVDYTQGYPGGRFASVALRLATRPTTGAASRDSVVPAAMLALPAGRPADPTPAAPTLEVSPEAAMRDASEGGGDRRTLLVTAPQAATTVEISGDFTNWDPVALVRRGDGRWSVALPLPAGVHQVTVRVNGGAWRVPAGLPTMDDEFGGVAGLLVVPPPLPPPPG